MKNDIRAEFVVSCFYLSYFTIQTVHFLKYEVFVKSIKKKKKNYIYITKLCKLGNVK